MQTIDPAEPAATKRCPKCAEEILAAAVRCKHCHASVVPSRSARLIVGMSFFVSTILWLSFKALAGFAMAEQGRLGVIVPTWNSLIAVGMLVVFGGLVGRREWARSWAMGTAFLNALADLFAMVESGEPALLIGILSGFAATVCLSGIQAEFKPRSKEGKWLDVVLSVLLIGGGLIVTEMGKQKPPTPPRTELSPPAADELSAEAQRAYEAEVARRVAAKKR